MDENLLRKKTINNMVYSFLGYALPIVFSIVVTPVVVRGLGIAEYGIYVLINTITAFLALVDLGLGVSMVKHLSEYHARSDWLGMQRLLNSANTLFFIIGIIGFIIYSIIGFYFLPAFKIDLSGSLGIYWVFVLAGVAFFLNASINGLLVVPAALQRYDIQTKLNLAQAFFLNIGILVLVLLGYKLKFIMLLSIVSLSFLGLVYYRYLRKLIPQVKFSFGWNRQEIIKLYKFGFLASITTLAYNALMQFDRLLIPAFVGPEQLTYYSLPGNVAQKSTGITGSLGTIFFPLTSALNIQGELLTIAKAYRTFFRNVIVLAAAMCLSIGLFGYKILHYWIGKDFADRGYVILTILSATYFFLSLYVPLTNFLLGLGKIRYLTKISIFMACLNLLFLFILVPKFGIVGAAWAFFGGVLPIPLFFYYTEHRILHLQDIGDFYLKLGAKVAITALISTIVGKYFLLPLVNNLISLILIGPMAVFGFLAFYKLLGFMEVEDWNMFVSTLKSIFFKITRKYTRMSEE